VEFRFYEIWREPEYVERLVAGVGWSLLLTITAATFGFCFAILLATGRRSANRLISSLSACYIELIRNTPLIVQLFFVVFGLPMLLGYRLPFSASALLALVLNFSAYYSEIIRAGLDNIDKGQIEAATVLNLTPLQRFVRVVLPQALEKVYPSLVSQFIFLFLTTGIISEVGIEELTWSGRFIADRIFRDFEVYLLLTLLYVLIAIGFKGLFYLGGQFFFPWRTAK